MKKIKTFLLVGIVFATTLFLSACDFDLSGLFGGGGGDANDFDAEQTYAIVEILEKHLEPCNYEGNHENSIGLSMMLAAYSGTEISFEQETNTNGTFEIVLSEQAQGNDTYFDFLSGDYTISGSTITLQNQNSQMLLKINDGKLIYSLPETQVSSGEHQGHTAVYSFVFKISV
jgi:hypothetical protein